MRRRHAELSSQLLRVVHAVDGLEGRFAEASHYHNSRAHQVHSALSQDLAQVEASLAPNSAGVSFATSMSTTQSRQCFAYTGATVLAYTGGNSANV